MIRGKAITLTIILACILACKSNKFESIHLSNVERNINLAGPYPTETVKLTIHADNDQISHFSYLVPLEYDSKINRLSFFKSNKEKSSLAFTRAVYIYNGGSFAHYRVKLPHNLNIDQQIDIGVQIVYLNRYVNLPQSITLSEDQRLQYQDSKYLVSPYKVTSQRSTYKFYKFIQFEKDGEKKGISEVSFSGSNIESFKFQKHIVFGVNNIPQVKFTSVEKIIELSHWGNVAITENYKMINTGPSLKGEFSRVTYGSRNQADVKNAYKGIEFDLPYEIWGLYYQDEVGNITTSHAFRDESSKIVRVSLNPRFSLLGGWKSNWQIGYNFNTETHLFHDQNKFELKNIKVQYALEKILAEDFTIKIVLPHGAENVRIKIGNELYDMSLVQVVSTEGYLDFNGRPTYVIDNYSGPIKDKHIEVYYDFSSNTIYEKPIRLFISIFALLFFMIFIKRFKLQAFSNSKLD